MFLQNTYKLKRNSVCISMFSVLSCNTGLMIWLGSVKLHIGSLGSVAQTWLEMILTSVLEIERPR